MTLALTVTGLVVIILVLLGVTVLATLAGGSGGPAFGCLTALFTFPLLALVVVLLFNSHSKPAQATSYAALLAALAAAFTWGVRSIKESLQSRAELLISEALSRQPMSRSEIRTMIYANNVLFRLSKSSYIDALNHLLEAHRVALEGGLYAMPDDGTRKT